MGYLPSISTSNLLVLEYMNTYNRRDNSRNFRNYNYEHNDNMSPRLRITATTELQSSDQRTNTICVICDIKLCDTITNCGHEYCRSCISNWFRKCETNAMSPSCPTCRHPLTAKSCSTIVIIL